MVQGGAEAAVRRGVPQPRRPVQAHGEHGLAVWAERHGADLALMGQGWPEVPARHRVPQPRRAVRAHGEYRLAVRPERHGEDRALMVQGGPTGRPVAASHSRAVLSQLAVSTALPSGLNATATTLS
jgi:hypothetical protein